MVIKRDTHVVYLQQKVLSLAAGKSETHSTAVTCKEDVTEIEATLSADIEDVVPEPNTLAAQVNNWASFIFNVALYYNQT
jgi:hypothetical protein